MQATTEIEKIIGPDTTCPEFTLAELKELRDQASMRFTELTTSVKALKENLSLQIKVLEDQFATQFKDILSAEESARFDFQLYDHALRERILEKYRETGNKQVDPELKLSIRLNRKFNIADKQAQQDWVRLSAPLLLKVDEKMFDKLLRGLPEPSIPSFVTIIDVPTAVIG